MNFKQIELFSNDIRITLIKALASKGGGHIGGCLSICDLLAVLYGGVLRCDPQNPSWSDRDYLVCSKGHAGPAIYAALALRGFFPMEWLDKLNMGGTNLPGHCDRLKVPGVDVTTGSLGQGLSIAAGIAHAAKINASNQIVYCIVGDGESDEGQIWEAVAYAANYSLGNLIAFTDWNKMQIDGTNDQVMKLGDLDAKYKACGWNAFVVDGSDVSEIYNAIQSTKGKDNNQPTMIILDTIKGAGISCIEEMENNHCIGVSQQLKEKCLLELEQRRKRLV